MTNDELFNRKAAVAFGPRGGLGRAFTDLRIQFKIEKTLESSPNKAEIRITNLSRDSRSIAEKEKQFLRLEVGYGDQLESIYSGDIARAITSLEGADYVTAFETGDGEIAYQSSRIDVSFAEGTSLVDIFKKVVSSFSGAAPDLSAIKDERVNGGLTLTGLSRSHMDALTARQGLQWSIQDGQVQILPAGGNTKNQAVLLSSDSGLIGIPKKKDKGIEGVSLLQPKIKPGGLIQIKSKNINGFFVVQKVVHAGDTHGPEWNSLFEALPAKNVEAAS